MIVPPIPPKTRFSSALILLFLTVISCDQSLETEYEITTPLTATNLVASTAYPPGAVKASSFGFKTGNATAAFQAAIKSTKSFIIIDKQSSDWIIEPSRFFYIKNKTIFFEPGVVVRAKTGAFGGKSDCLIDFYKGENITLEGYGASLKMNKSEYTTGEWRHALRIDEGRNITVKGLSISDSGGDGINISAARNGYSQGITLQDVICDNNRRMGLSIISAQDVWVRNSTFRNTKGTLPEAGVDLEPDRSGQRLVNINFMNCKFSGNDSAGFQIGMLNMNSSSIPLSIVVSDSEFSQNAVAPNGTKPATELNINAGSHGNPVGGNVKFERINFNGSKSRVLFSRKSDKAFFVSFKDCSARNVIQNSSVPPFEFEAQLTTTNLGGFAFNNFYVEYLKDQPFMSLSTPKGFPLKNITGNFTIKEPYNNPIAFKNGASPSTGTNVNIAYKHIN